MLSKTNPRDYLSCNIFEEIMKSLDKAYIEFKMNNPNIDSQRFQQQAIQKINFDVQQFIESSINMKSTVLLEYSRYNFPDLIAFFLVKAQQLILENVTSVKEFKISIGIQLYIYYDIITRCCFGLKKEITDSEKTNGLESETLFNDVLASSEIVRNYLIDQSLLIYHNDLPKELLFVRNQFSILLSTLGSHYYCFYDFFVQHISSILNSTLPSSTVIIGSLVSTLDSVTPSQGSSSLVSKYLTSILSPLIKLPGDNNGLNVLLSLTKTTLEKTTPLKSSYRQSFSDTLLYSILYFFKLHFYLNANANRNYRNYEFNSTEDFQEDDSTINSKNQAYDYKAKGKVSQAGLLFPTCPIDVISNLAKIIDQWNEKHSKFTWPTQIALLLLSSNKKEIFSDPSLLNDHSLLHQLRNSTDEKQKIGPTDVFPDICSFSPAFDDNNRKSLLSCLENFPNLKNYQKEFASMSILVAFKIYSLSCRNNIARDFILLYFENFLDYFLKQKICSSITNSDFFTKCLYIDFPICILFMRKNDLFKKKIIPILNEKNDGPLYIAKIIRRLCRQGPTLKFDQIFDQFIDLTIWLFNKAESDSPLNPNSKTKEADCKQILNILITAFSSYPTFTRKVICMKDMPFNTKNVDTIIESARKHPDLPWHTPLLLFFESFTDTEYFAVINSLLSFLFEMYCNIPLDQSISQFEKSIPKVIETIAISPLFQQSLLQMDVSNELNDSEQDEESESISTSMMTNPIPTPLSNAQQSITLANLTYQQYSGKQSLQFLKSIIPTLEMSALMFIASSKKAWRNYGVNIFNCILNFTSSDSLIDVLNLKIPIDLYHSIVHDAANKNIPTGHESYKNPLRRITFSTASVGYIDCWTHLYKHLISLTTKIRPSFKAIFEEQPTSQKSKQKVKDQTIYEAYLPPLQDENYLSSEQAQLNPFITPLSGANNEVVETSQKDSDIMSEWIGCASILFAISACPNNNLNRLFNESFLLIYDIDDIGPMMIGTLPFSLNSSQGINYLKKITEVVDKLKKCGNVGKNSQNDILFIQNLMKIVIGFMKQDIFWEKDVISPNIEMFSSLIQNFVFFCNTFSDIDCRKFCCQMIILILTLMNKFDTVFEPLTRHEIARTILSWLSVNKITNVPRTNSLPNSSTNPNLSINNGSNESGNSNLNDSSNSNLAGDSLSSMTDDKITKELQSNIFSALALLLDNLSFLECVDSNDPRSHDEQAEGVFISYFFVLKAILERNEKGQSKELIPVLTSLLKQNIDLGIYHCISCTFSLKEEARAAFISAMASVFKSSSEDDDKKGSSLIPDVANLTLGDILFTPGSGLDLIEYICDLVPYSCANNFGAALIETAMSKGCEMQLLERMIDMELRQVDPMTKNSLFRGNAVPANTVGSLPRLVGTKWMKETLRPLFEEVIANCQKGLSYVLDPEIIKANLPAQNTNEENKVDPIVEKVNEQLEINRQNVREMLLKSTDTIYNAFNNMPVGIIKEAQLIYKKVYEKYGDFAMNILGGFLFLRFLLPPFTLTSIVGLPAVIDEKPRKALVDQCRILNSAINKGTVDDKPEYQCFIDTAETIYMKFNDMFKKILKADVKDRKDEVTLDLEKSNATFHSVLYSVIEKMDKKLQSGEELLPESTDNSAQNSSQNQRTSSAANIALSASSSNLSVEKVELAETESQNEIAASESQVDDKKDDNEAHISARMALGMLLMKLQALGEPEKPKKNYSPSKTSAKKDDKGNKPTSKKPKYKVSTFENFMKLKIKPEDVSKYSTFFVKEENNATDGSAIYYMFFDKLDSDDFESKEIYLPYYVLKTLNEEKNPKVICVLILNKFDPSKLPTKNFKTYMNMAPSNKIQKYVLLETNKEFIDFLYDYEKQSESSNIEKFIEVKDLTQYSKVVGFPSKHLPFTCIESLSQANSSHTAVVAFKKYEYKTVLIHRQSIQLISEAIPYNNKIKFKYIKFILISHISSLLLKDSSKNSNNNNDENENENDTCTPFVISTKEGEKFLFKPQNAALYDVVYALRTRPVSLQQMSNKSKKIDELTLQWLMLNLAYSNLIGEEQQGAIRKASLDLTYSIFHAFNFKRSMAIAKMPENAIPTYLLNYVVQISEDISKNNPEGYVGFISEFFYEMREMRHTNKNLAFEYLKPWIVIWLDNIDKNPEFTKKMMNYILLSNAQSFVGSILIEKLDSLESFIRSILKQRDQSMINQIANYSFNMEKEVTLFMVDTMMKECINNAATSESEKARGNHLLVIIGIISQLINSNAFYLNNDEAEKDKPNKCIVSLLYNLVELRLIYSQDVLNKTRDFFGNFLRYINRNNDNSISNCASDVNDAFASRDGVKFITNEFSVQQEEESFSPSLTSTDSGSNYLSKKKKNSKFDLMNFLTQKRNWLVSTQKVASAINEAFVNDPKTAEQLYFMYRDIIDNAPANETNGENLPKRDPLTVARIANAIIFAGAISGNHVEEFISLAISLITKKDKKDYTTFYSVSFSFCNLNLNGDQEKKKILLSKMFYIGVCCSLYLRTGIPLELMASSISEFFGPSSSTLLLPISDSGSYERMYPVESTESGEITEPTESTEIIETSEEVSTYINNDENDEALLKFVSSISSGIPESVISSLTSMTGLPFNKNPVFSSLVLISLYSLNPLNFLNAIEKVSNSKAIRDPFAKVLSLIINDDYLDDALETEFGDDSSTVMVSCLFILKLAEEIFEYKETHNMSETINTTSPFHQFLLSLQKKSPELFSSIDMKGDFGKCMMNLIHEPQLRYIFISQCLSNIDSNSESKKVSFPSLISSMIFNHNDEPNTSDYNYSYESIKARFSMGSQEIKWWNMLATLKRSKIALAETDLDSLLNEIVDLHD